MSSPRAPYRSIAPCVRDELARVGAASPREIAGNIAADPNTVLKALAREVSAGRAGSPFPGVYALPAVASQIQAVVAAHRAEVRP